MKLVFVFMICYLASTLSAAAMKPERLNPSSCQPLPSSFNALAEHTGGKNWSRYLTYMKICPVIDGNGKLVLDVLALSVGDAAKAGALLWKNDKPWNPETDEGPADPIPLPVIVDAGFAPVGRLPEQVYPSFPQDIKIYFYDWQNDFPQKIILFVNDPTQEAPHLPYCPPPMVWQASSHKYVQPAGDYFGDCPSLP